MAQEQMKLYKESGMNPIGCLGPMLIQMPIWIALYQSIMLSLAVAPEGLLNLSRYLYAWPLVYSIVPLGREFMGLNLAEPNMVLAILVGGTMWLQQKMATPTSTDPKQQAQSRMMLWMLPMMFTFFALSFPSGLSLFWVTSSVVRIVMQYKVTGWGGLLPKAAQAQRPVGRGGQYARYITRLEDERSWADIVDKGGGKEKRDRGVARPSDSRYQPGKDRRQHPKKK